MVPDKETAVEKLKKSLYSRSKKRASVSDVRTPLNPERPEVPVSWAPPVTEEELEQKAVEEKAANPFLRMHKDPPLTQFSVETKKGMSFAAKFLIGSVLFFIVAAGVAAFMFFGGVNLISPSNIDLTVDAPSLVDSGKPITFQILVNNHNTSALNLVDLVLTYPDGTRDAADATKSVTSVRQSLGTINPGQQVKTTASAIFYGQEGTQKKVAVVLEYSVAGSNAIFQKQTESDVLIGSSPVSLSVEAPSEAVSGQAFTVDVTVQNNSTTMLQNVVVQGQYPFGYSVTSANPQSVAGGTFWRLGSINPGASQVIHLSGVLTGVDGDSRVFRFLVGSNSDSTDTTVSVPLLSVPQTLTIKQPFISGTISVNGQSGKIISVQAGQTLQGTIVWKNNLTEPISNAELVLSLAGPALDKSAVSSATGFYQSQNNTITWGSSQDPTLAQVPPGGTGTLTFSFSSLPPGAGNVLVTNPIINLNLQVSGTRQSDNGSPESVSSAASAQVSLASALSLTAQALHFSSGGTGPMPPKAESATTYSVVWTIKNSSNDIANARVSTVLPTYVTYLSGGAGVTYDSGSRTVTWAVGDLKPGVGYTLPVQTTTFNISLTPSITQVGQSPQLTGAAQLTGQDRFAQVDVQTSANPLTTALQEQGFVSGMELVAPK